MIYVSFRVALGIEPISFCGTLVKQKIKAKARPVFARHEANWERQNYSRRLG